MKFSNTIKTRLKIYQKYVKNSVWYVLHSKDAINSNYKCTSHGGMHLYNWWENGVVSRSHEQKYTKIS